MSDSTLLLPDSGPDFLRALNLAVLYSETVHVFTLTKPETAAKLESALRTLDTATEAMNAIDQVLTGKATDREEDHSDVASTDAGHVDEAYGFLKFTHENAPLLSLAEGEGVLTSVTEFALREMENNKQGTRYFVEVFKEIIELGQERSPGVFKDADELFVSALLESPSSFPFLLERLFAYAVFYGSAKGGISKKTLNQIAERPESLLLAASASYTLAAAFYSLASDLGGVTWQRATQDCFERCIEFVRHGMPSINELLARRHAITNSLGRMVLEEEVPNVADLPFTEILEIRRKRNPELLAFRHGIRELSAGIDPSLEGKKLELEMDATIQKVFKPAMRDLRTSISELRLDSISRLLHPSNELRVAVIPAVIAVSAGAPVQTTATVGAIAGILGKLYEFTVGRAIAQKKILQTNSWSILFRLENAAKRSQKHSSPPGPR